MPSLELLSRNRCGAIETERAERRGTRRALNAAAADPAMELPIQRHNGLRTDIRRAGRFHRNHCDPGMRVAGAETARLKVRTSRLSSLQPASAQRSQQPSHGSLDAREVVRGNEHVNVSQGSLHTARYGLVARSARQWIEPDDSPRSTA